VTFVREKIENQTLFLTIDRSDRLNALGVSLADELSEKLATVQKCLKRPSQSWPYRLLVLQASPVARKDSLIWVAGGDLKELSKLKSKKEAGAYSKKLSAFCSGLERLPIPTIAALDGQAIGGGAELALACDLRLATKESKLHFKQLQIGLATGYGGALRLVNLVGRSRATEILLLGKMLDAHEAQSASLLHEVFADSASMNRRITELGSYFSSLNAESVAAQKAMLQAVSNSQKPLLLKELQTFEGLWMNPVHKNVLAKFS
jgi:enoyl-CoA hydratase